MKKNISNIFFVQIFKHFWKKNSILFCWGICPHQKTAKAWILFVRLVDPIRNCMVSVNGIFGKSLFSVLHAWVCNVTYIKIEFFFSKWSNLHERCGIFHRWNFPMVEFSRLNFFRWNLPVAIYIAWNKKYEYHFFVIIRSLFMQNIHTNVPTTNSRDLNEQSSYIHVYIFCIASFYLLSLTMGASFMFSTAYH